MDKMNRIYRMGKRGRDHLNHEPFNHRDTKTQRKPGSLCLCVFVVNSGA